MRLTFAGCLASALVLHGAFAFALARTRTETRAPIAILEMDLTPPPAESPPPPPPAAPPAANEERAPAPTAAHAHAPAPGAKAPALGKAAPLVTSSAPPASREEEDEAVAFVTDPNGASYGSGVVGRGGTASHGAEGARRRGAGDAPAPHAVGPAGDGELLTPAASLSRAPRLDEIDACRGFFPQSADSDVATVALLLVIRSTGAVASAAVIAETPAGEGFGAAARACLLSKRFVPGLDRDGHATATSTKINVRFSR